MAIIKCPECGSEISERAQKCPVCGCPSSMILYKSKMICDECGTEFERGLSSCPKCGCPNPNLIILNKTESNNKNRNEFCSNENSSQSLRVTKPIGFIDAIKICIQEKYATFSGRASRSEYWLFYLFESLLTFIPSLMLGLSYFNYVVSSNFYYDYDGYLEYFVAVGFKDMLVWLIIVLLMGTFLFLPHLSVSVRRLHDTNKSGFFYLLGLIPYGGPLILIVLMALPSDPEDNRYGPKV